MFCWRQDYLRACFPCGSTGHTGSPLPPLPPLHPLHQQREGFSVNAPPQVSEGTWGFPGRLRAPGWGSSWALWVGRMAQVGVTEVTANMPESPAQTWIKWEETVYVAGPMLHSGSRLVGSDVFISIGGTGLRRPLSHLQRSPSPSLCWAGTFWAHPIGEVWGSLEERDLTPASGVSCKPRAACPQDSGFSGTADRSVGARLGETSPCLRQVAGEGGWEAGRMLIFIQQEYLLH